MFTLLKRPGAFLPIAMSAIVLASICAELALSGPVRESDEGTAAHLFQILMPAQVPIMAFFAYAWLPRDRGAALKILALQLVCALPAFAMVFFLHL